MMETNIKIIAFHTRKGGVGKTTLNLNLGVGVKRIKKTNVLIIDCDPQANSTNSLRKKDQLTLQDIGIIKWFDPSSDVETLTKSILESNIDGVYYVSSGQELEQYSEYLLTKIGREKILARSVAKVLKSKYLEKLGVQTIIFDAGPNFNVIAKNVYLSAIDGVIQVVDSSKFSLDTLNLNLKTWEKEMEESGYENNIKGIILNKAKSGKMTKDMYELLNTKFPQLIFKSIIPNNSSFEKSVIPGQKWVIDDTRLNHWKKPKWILNDDLMNISVKEGNPIENLVNEMIDRNIL